MKKAVLKNFEIFRNINALLKRDSSLGVFLCMLRNF